MATVLDYVKVKCNLEWSFTNSIANVDDGKYVAAHKISDSLTDGNAVDQAQMAYYEETDVANGVPYDLDLAGALTNAYGVTATFVKVKSIMIQNTSTTAAQILTISRPAANGLVLFGAASDSIALGPGGLFWWYVPSAAAIAVTAGTGDLLTLTSASGTITCKIAVIGTDA